MKKILFLTIALVWVILSQAANSKASAGDQLQFRSSGHVLLFNKDGFTAAGTTHALKVSFVHAQGVTPVGVGDSTATGNPMPVPAGMPKQPADKMPLLKQVTYNNLWKGVTLTYKASPQGVLESTYRLDPDKAGRVDASQISLRYNRDLSLATTITPMEGLSLDLSYAHDDVFSETDLCYAFIATAKVPLPDGAANSGVCVNSASNPNASPTFFLGNGFYSAPSNFFAASFNYAPSKFFRVNAGARVNSTNGTAEQLNPLMVPGALHSKFVTPFADLQVNVAQQWAWHGNWVHDGYSEGGPKGNLPQRDTHGDILTLGVKYAF